MCIEDPVGSPKNSSSKSANLTDFVDYDLCCLSRFTGPEFIELKYANSDSVPNLVDNLPILPRLFPEMRLRLSFPGHDTTCCIDKLFESMPQVGGRNRDRGRPNGHIA